MRTACTFIVHGGSDVQVGCESVLMSKTHVPAGDPSCDFAVQTGVLMLPDPQRVVVRKARLKVNRSAFHGSCTCRPMSIRLYRGSPFHYVFPVDVPAHARTTHDGLELPQRRPR